MFIFFDDFQPIGPFGASTLLYKLGGVYISIPCLPPHIVAKICSIFMHTVFHSKDRETYGNDATFKKLIEDVNLLATNGVKVDVDGVTHTLYFKTVLVLGDNLGLIALAVFLKVFLLIITVESVMRL